MKDLLKLKFVFAFCKRFTIHLCLDVISSDGSLVNVNATLKTVLFSGTRINSQMTIGSLQSRMFLKLSL